MGPCRKLKTIVCEDVLDAFIAKECGDAASVLEVGEVEVTVGGGEDEDNDAHHGFVGVFPVGADQDQQEPTEAGETGHDYEYCVVVHRSRD